MSDIIHLLPEHVANQIAAGEVVQRPASVVKELLDNSVDAGASQIGLYIKEAGKTLIQVQDNGKGMSPTDARMCWERHATSKISGVEDLFRLRTMGFRGEALASIAAVAQVELKTKRAEEELGTHIRIEGSEVMQQEHAATHTGSTIQVKNLFFNVPARRNFLKSNPVETRHILNEFVRMALAHPEIAFSFQHNENKVYQLSATDLKGRVLQLFEGRKESELIAFEEETTMMRISGFVGTPGSAKKSRDEQFFFVNNRFIKDPYLHHAVMGCYNQLITNEQFPLYLINIEIDPKEIDVNIHPTKTEIKFQDERSVYLVLKTVIRKALGEYHTVPVYESTATMGTIPLSPIHPDAITPIPQIQSNKPINTSFSAPPSYKRDRAMDWEKLFETPEKEEVIIPRELAVLRTLKEDIGPAQLMQLEGRYLVAQTAGGLLVVYQQSAHERVLYEKYLKASTQHPVSSQQKLFPRVIELSKADFLLAADLLDELRLMGFDVAEFGSNNLIVHGIPAYMEAKNEEELLLGILEDYKMQDVQGKNQRKETLALLLAKRGAIKTGQKMQQEEMRQLVEDLFYCDDPAFTPLGKRTFIRLGVEQIAELFNK